MNTITTEYINAQTNLCFSGGADGADYIFGEYALDCGIQPMHFSFMNHKTNVPTDTIVQLPDFILKDKKIVKALKKANLSLGRSVPKIGTTVYNLLARNFYQILHTSRIYAISDLESPSRVSGGTAWAVQMFIDRVENPEIYVYSPYDRGVYQYCNTLKEFVIVDKDVGIPTPSGKWTGIGSRKATYEDFNEMKEYFR